MIFATSAASTEQFDTIRLLVESLRTFGGRFKDMPLWVYVPEEAASDDTRVKSAFASLSIEIKPYAIPEDVAWYYFADKVHASALAETEAAGHADVLAWLGPDTIFLREPSEFVLPPGKSLAYRPVMHKNIGLLWDEPIDPFWLRAYALTGVSEADLFPMVTPADEDTIRPYFNAGCLVLRPEIGLCRRWVKVFEMLTDDDELRAICGADVNHRIFIHQAALTCVFLKQPPPQRMLALSDRYNYPIFFERMFGARKTFDDITDVVTLRHESYFKNPDPDWYEKLKGPTDRKDWIQTHLLGS